MALPPTGPWKLSDLMREWDLSGFPNGSSNFYGSKSNQIKYYSQSTFYYHVPPYNNSAATERLHVTGATNVARYEFSFAQYCPRMTPDQEIIGPDGGGTGVGGDGGDSGGDGGGGDGGGGDGGGGDG